IWDRFLGYELGQLHFVMDLMKQLARRDPQEFLQKTLPEPVKFESQRKFIREVLSKEVDLRASGATFIPRAQEPVGGPSPAYRRQLNSEGSPSETVADGYCWSPGTELSERIGSVQTRTGGVQ
ncbi:MAG TPA: hypothetical protein VGF45_01800, partial [Polyangia bacterium]